jgi:hypothetical protein
MNEVGGKGSPLSHLRGSSFESFEDAVIQALSGSPRSGDHRVLDVVRLSVEEGGIVGRIQYHVDLLVPREIDDQQSGAPPRDEPAEPAVAPSPRVADASRLEELPPELRSRVVAATSHAEHRFISGRGAMDEYEVHALIGDRFVHMLLSMRPGGSVEETTETLLRNQIVGVGIEHGQGSIEVEDASGRRSIPVPVGLAQALTARL